jgi:GSH-dependent disulfide-bond oxidoreductase
LSIKEMNDGTPYLPPKVWHWERESESWFANVNRPVAGATHDKELPVGKHLLQLYSLGTPNGVKVTVLLEELLAIGKEGAEYDAWFINIGEGDQFSSGFVDINPNSKIPAMVDYSTSSPTRVFESGAIMLYLAEKFDAFVPKQGQERAECLSWLFWQIGSAPFLGGGFGHFYAYAPEKLEYPINRYAMEIKRQLDVLDRELASRQFLCGDNYNIADMAVYSWYGQLVLTGLYESREFLDVASYTNLTRWAAEVHARPAVRRGRKVNRDSDSGIRERHHASDLNTLDKN